MNPTATSRRFFLAIFALIPLIGGCQSSHPWTHSDAPDKSAKPLIAYVGTFSSALKDMLPTQVDLPPGNGHGIHFFRVDRQTGKLTTAGIVEMGTSPTCLAVNAAGTILYCANENEHVGPEKEGTISAFAIDGATGSLHLL